MHNQLHVACQNIYDKINDCGSEVLPTIRRYKIDMIIGEGWQLKKKYHYNSLYLGSVGITYNALLVKDTSRFPFDLELTSIFRLEGK